jgi:uncharacterized protein YyaL (SSP411 family)
MISALARGGAAFQDSRYLEAAAKAADFLRQNLTTDVALLRTWRAQAGKIAAFAEDYAFLIQGLLDLYEASWDSEWLSWAIQLQESQDRLFQDERGGGYFSSTAGDPLISVRMKEDYDGAEPSVNSISALNLLRLARVLHDHRLEARARRVIATNRQTLDRMPTAGSSDARGAGSCALPTGSGGRAGSRKQDVRRMERAIAPRFPPTARFLLGREWFPGQRVPS